MTLDDVGMTPEEVMQVRDRPLEDAYEVHDVGEDYLVARLEAHGYHVEDHGDDARHADEVFYGDGPDLAVYRGFDEHEQTPVGLLAYIEIKCKEDPEWVGRCNRRHFEEYANFAGEVDAPVFICFLLVDAQSGEIHREAYFEVEPEMQAQVDGEVVDVGVTGVTVRETDLQHVKDDLVYVDADDIVGVRSGDVIADTIPEVHGNEVLCLDEDRLRSFPHVQYRLDG